jgi:uncharacterized protein DUF5672
VLKLPDVTLVLIETREHDLAQLALEDCERLVEFGDVLVFTDRPSQFMRADRRIITVPDWPEKIGWSRCFWYDVARHVHTTHSLGIQWDSWVVDTEAWMDDFLEFDYVGAPWWYNDGMNVGNGGFCLRSTAFLRFIRAKRAEVPCVTALDDDLYCRKYRTALQGAGFEWAPEPIAQRFAFECVRPDKSARHFGFHAAYNFDYGCQNDRERILERARLMAKSEYITKKSPYIWQGFVKRNPWVAEEIKIETGVEIILPDELPRDSALAAVAFSRHKALEVPSGR